jgi:hypothetical protein
MEVSTSGRLKEAGRGAGDPGDHAPSQLETGTRETTMSYLELFVGLFGIFLLADASLQS